MDAEKLAGYSALEVTTPPSGRFYVQSQALGDLALFETPDETVADAKEKRAAPFTLFELIPHPRALVHSNGPTAILEAASAKG
jgi:hypothetical protein